MNAANPPVANRSNNPPTAPLAFRVGAVGHRPDRLDNDKLDELAATMSMILSTVKQETRIVGSRCGDLYNGAHTIMTAVGSLAEGADRIFADQALALGFKLCAVLPFPQAEFEKDFTSDDAMDVSPLDRFRRVLGKATIKFELDGTRAEESEAYREAGLVVLNQSDLLIVVWDGQRLGKRGGTEDIFDEVRRRAVTIAWIDAQEPTNWQLLDGATLLPKVVAGQRVRPDGSGSAEAVGKFVREVLELPELPNEGKRKSHDRRIAPGPALKTFYAERRPRRSFAVVWKAFLQIVGDARWRKIRLRVTDFEAAVLKEWPRDDSTPIARFVNRLRTFYAWPDQLAILYANRYRSAFISIYLIAAFAVMLALVPVALELPAHHIAEIAFIGLELAAIICILLLLRAGRQRHWHERWLDYRLTAELVRHVRVVAPLGGRRPLPQIPAHWLTYGQPAASWMAWYVRAVERWLGLPGAVVDRAYLNDYLNHLRYIVVEQMKYHQTTARRYQKMDRRLHRWGRNLFFVTAIFCAAHLVLGVWRAPARAEWLPPWLTFLCGFLPALGAGLAAIVNQGEFHNLTNRSRAMRDQLRSRLTQIKKLRRAIIAAPSPSVRQFSTEAEVHASGIADLLLDEVLDWRVVLLDQPLRTPG